MWPSDIEHVDTINVNGGPRIQSSDDASTKEETTGQHNSYYTHMAICSSDVVPCVNV